MLAAESQSILVAALVPIFVASLALASFMNGFWMVKVFVFFFAPIMSHSLCLVCPRIFHQGNIITPFLVLLGSLDRKLCLRGLMVIHLITEKDYQTFAFQLLVRNDSIGLIFQCPHVDGSCLCPFASSLVPEQCALTGDDLIKV